MYFCFKKCCLVEHKRRSIFRCCGNTKTLSVTGEIRNNLGTNCVRLQVIAKRTLKCLNSAKSLDRTFCSLKCVRWQIMRWFSFRVIFALFLEKASGLCVTSLFMTSSNKILTEISVTCPHQVSLNLWVGLCLCVCIDGAHRRSLVKSCAGSLNGLRQLTLNPHGPYAFSISAPGTESN